MSTKLIFIIFIILSALVAIGCKEDNPASSDDQTEGDLSLFGKNSYFPIVENATWTYNYGETVKITNVDTVNNTFEITNVGTQGTVEGYSDKDANGVYVTSKNWTTTNFLPLRAYFGFSPIMYENSKISLTLHWSYSDVSGGYPFKNECTITSLSTNFTTPGGQIYDNCIVLQRNISYSNGYDWNPYITQVLYYVKQGVGFVGEIKTWSNGSQDINYVTSYNIP